AGRRAAGPAERARRGPAKHRTPEAATGGRARALRARVAGRRDVAWTDDARCVPPGTSRGAETGASLAWAPRLTSPGSDASARAGARPAARATEPVRSVRPPGTAVRRRSP